MSFCSHAILQDQLFEIPDATKDSRFSDNPLVLNDPSIRFYAGVPLVTSNGSRLGTLCVIDKIPGHLNEDQKFGLKVLANNVIKIAELRIKNKELHYLTETQKRTISILAHDVRNPLSSIKNIIELKQANHLNAEEAAEMMEMVAGQLNSTILMVENVVNWGKLQLQLGHLTLEDVDLFDIVKRVFNAESLKSKAKNNKLINLISRDTIVHSDQQSLEFILRNLVGNANKFTGNGKITVDAQQIGLKTQLQVTDTGVGMTDEQVNNLFNNSTSRTTLGTNREKGSGLGLMLVKEFVDRINGCITVNSVINKGTRFTITL